MQFSAIFKRLCKQHGITQKQALANMGFGESTSQKWKTGMPQSESLQVIAEYFDVSADWLLAQCSEGENSISGNIIGSAVVQGSSDSSIRFNTVAQADRESHGAEQLTEQEAELLRIFRTLNMKGKITVMSCAYTEEERQA